jgi:hypothetical protein
MQMIQAGSSHCGSLLSLRQNEGTLDNCLHVGSETLGAPLSVATVNAQRFSNVQFKHGDMLAETLCADVSDCRMRLVGLLHQGAEQTGEFG